MYAQDIIKQCSEECADLEGKFRVICFNKCKLRKQKGISSGEVSQPISEAGIAGSSITEGIGSDIVRYGFYAILAYLGYKIIVEFKKKKEKKGG